MKFSGEPVDAPNLKKAQSTSVSNQPHRRIVSVAGLSSGNLKPSGIALKKVTEEMNKAGKLVKNSDKENLVNLAMIPNDSIAYVNT